MDFPDDFEYRHLQGSIWLTRPKSDSGWRIIPLVEPLRSFIELRISTAVTEPNPHGLVWTADPKRDKRGNLLPLDGAPIQPSHDNKAWHAVLARAGVPDARLHDARHTTASLLLKAGVPERVIMEILGHNSYAVTMKYQHVDKAQLSRAMEDLSARFELEE
ncbi:hypothetical protein ASE16_03630 [Leifsonia sp. Root227]|nr:hypothetical protein ASE16_03630 [Leifsonia sp. Root227]